MRIIKKQKLEIYGLCVCENFDDYLRFTLPFNIPIFKKTFIVTTPEDIRTQKVCSDFNVNCIMSNRIHENNAPFNKAKAINDGYKYIPKNNWICIFDSDIILPRFNYIINKLDRLGLYGMKRNQINIKDINYYIKSSLNIIPEDIKWFKFRQIIGYFQLFHSSNIKRLLLYDEIFSTATGSDGNFSDLWNKEKRYRFNDLICFHISEPRINWNGRVSKRL